MRNKSKAAATLVKKNTPNFPRWSNTFNEFRAIQMDESGLFPEDESQVWKDLQMLCMEMMDLLIEASNIRETWDPIHFLPLVSPIGLEAIYQTHSIPGTYIFCMNEKGFFLETVLHHPEGIRKMNDTFWFRLAELSQLGNLDYVIERVPEPGEARQFPSLHKKSKSKLFTLIQDAIATEQVLGSTGHLGILQVQWKFDTPWDTLLTHALPTLQNLYFLNKALYEKK